MPAGPSESFYSSVIPVAVLVVALILWGAAIRRRQQRRRAAQHPEAAVPSGTAPTAVTSPPHSTPPLPTISREPGAVTLSAGRFTPLEELGRGGMGVVWRARDTVLGRQVAIKQLLPPAGLSATLTEAGAIIGTPAYMAPEQIRGLENSPAIDLWGLGATLFYAAEGLSAFGGPSPTAVLAAVLTDPPRTPQRAGSPLGQLLISLLAKDPKDRPTAAQLRSDLSQLTLST